MGRDDGTLNTSSSVISSPSLEVRLEGGLHQIGERHA